MNEVFIYVTGPISFQESGFTLINSVSKLNFYSIDFSLKLETKINIYGVFLYSFLLEMSDFNLIIFSG